MAMLKRWSVTCLLVLASLPALGLALQQSPSPAPAAPPAAPLGPAGPRAPVTPEARALPEAQPPPPALAPRPAQMPRPAQARPAPASAEKAKEKEAAADAPGGPILGLQIPLRDGVKLNGTVVNPAGQREPLPVIFT